MSTLKVGTIQNTAGVQQYLCQAWVNFNGTGTVAIRASGNVSSITDVGVGEYTVNFTNAMIDANYCTVTSSISRNDATNSVLSIHPTTAQTASAVAIKDEVGTTGGSADLSLFNVAIFR